MDYYRLKREQYKTHSFECVLFFFKIFIEKSSNKNR